MEQGTPVLFDLSPAVHRNLIVPYDGRRLVKQEFYGLLLAHYAIRGLMHDAALKAGLDPDELSFAHAVRVVRRKMPLYAALPPSASDGVSRARA